LDEYCQKKHEMQHGPEFISENGISASNYQGHALIELSRNHELIHNLSISGQPGVEFVCEYKRRKFYLSENKMEKPSSIKRLIKVLKFENGFVGRRN
jgi:heterodisulfide reductase subunit B